MRIEIWLKFWRIFVLAEAIAGLIGFLLMFYLLFIGSNILIVSIVFLIAQSKLITTIVGASFYIQVEKLINLETKEKGK